MPLSFNDALGIHEQALQVRARRMELLSSNIANADTPHYKARDLDFRQALEEADTSGAVSLHTTHATHIPASGKGQAGETLYRVPTQPSLDGNTVDPQLEQAAFAENSVQYQASLDFLGDKFVGLKNALKGGQ
ncbi:MAG: flagellar basal body rod protein FlgB [Ectothiorhodospira sp.]